MSFEENLQTISVEAGGDLSAGQYKIVDVASDGQMDLVTTLGAKAIGVLQDKPAAAGRPGCVAIGGTTKAVCGAAVTRGTEVTVDATSRVITTSAVDQHIIGTALETSTAAGQIIAVRLKQYQRSA